MTCASLQFGDDRNWEVYPRGVLAAGIRRGVLPVGAGADLLLDSDVPVGAGLSSSAALGVAVLMALAGLHAVELDPVPAAEVCAEAERVQAGAPTGLLDPLASLLSRPGEAVLLDFQDLSWRHVPVRLDGWALLVVDTRVTHAVADGAYAQRRASVEAAAEAIGLPSLRSATLDQVDGLPDELRRRARHVVTENDRVLAAVGALEAGEVERLGSLMTASHVSLRDDFEVSCAELDLVVDVALAAGAAGARLTGAGFGGSAIVLLPASGAVPFGNEVRSAYRRAGFRSPTIAPVTPSAGARRLDG
ncbi:MAG TPA: galactokinase [Frankiaceae bacterium]|nr:galactokinase [Frankiaceae bacterium]